MIEEILRNEAARRQAKLGAAALNAASIAGRQAGDRANAGLVLSAHAGDQYDALHTMALDGAGSGLSGVPSPVDVIRLVEGKRGESEHCLCAFECMVKNLNVVDRALYQTRTALDESSYFVGVTANDDHVFGSLKQLLRNDSTNVSSRRIDDDFHDRVPFNGCEHTMGMLMTMTRQPNQLRQTR